MQVLVVLVLLLQNVFVSLYCHSSEKDCEIDSPYENSDVWHFHFLYHYKHSYNKEIRDLNAKQISCLTKMEKCSGKSTIVPR